VIRTEDDLRALFDTAVTPDVPPPAFAQIRTRAQRRRIAQAGSAVAAAAVLVAGGVGITAAVRGGSGPDLGPETAIPASVPGHPAAWLVNEQTIGHHTYSVASYVETGRACLALTRDQTWCARGDWPSTVADYKVLSTPVSREVVVVGRVPLAANTVTVHYAARQVTVTAVRTPTSSDERFFAAAIRVAPHTLTDLPLLGVTDANGRAVTPIGDVGGVNHASETSHVASLPSSQVLLGIDSGGQREIAYTVNGKVCAAIVTTQPPAVHTGCSTSTPTAASVLVRWKATGQGAIQTVVGIAPRWATATIVSRASYSQPDAIAARGIDSVNFFTVQGNDGLAPYQLVTCHAGQNCTGFQPYRP
jgi:hypothetical protein